MSPAAIPSLASSLRGMILNSSGFGSSANARTDTAEEQVADEMTHAAVPNRLRPRPWKRVRRLMCIKRKGGMSVLGQADIIVTRPGGPRSTVSFASRDKFLYHVVASAGHIVEVVDVVGL